MKSIFFIVAIFALLSFVPPTWAQSPFDAEYDLDYSISPSGLTIVTQKVTLTNLQTNLYPKEYSIVIDSEKIQNIIARDRVDLIKPVVSQNYGKTTIGLTFNEQVVGVGNKLTFTLRYENLDIVTKNGNIWEIYVPGIEDDESLREYMVTLNVPPTFGPLAYRTPAPYDGRRWNKQQMVKGGIAAAYGSEQTFALTLDYHLQNSRITPVVSDIALPPDTAYQRVIVQSMDPLPKQVIRDSDGNWLATYEIPGASKKKVTAKLLVSLWLSARPGWKDEIDVGDYVKDDQFWEVSDDQIQKLARIYNKPRAIYDYVVGSLTYNYDRVNLSPVRRGALGGLTKADDALCMEFTDLFIAIARAAGIPAREVVGYAHTTNSRLRPLSFITDVLHAWPEYYDTEKRLWIPIDPTWANTTAGVDYFTKLDFNHIVFAIHGKSSKYPYPAGSYRELGQTGKDVTVSFAGQVTTLTPGTLTTAIDIPKRVSAGTTLSGFIRVTNQSNVSVDTADITIESQPYSFQLKAIENRIPPNSSFSYPVKIPIDNYIASGYGRVIVTVNGQQFLHIFTIVPMYWLLLPVFGIIMSSLFLVWLFTHGRFTSRSS